jgi:hypothetical protein
MARFCHLRQMQSRQLRRPPDLTPERDFAVVPDLDPNPADGYYGLTGPEQQQSFCCHSAARARADPDGVVVEEPGTGHSRDPDGEGDVTDSSSAERAGCDL